MALPMGSRETLHPSDNRHCTSSAKNSDENQVAATQRKEMTRPPHIRLGRATARRVRDARLMLRLSRRLRPVGGCRCFNALQIRSQGRVLYVFLLRPLGLDRR
jgi:hypothetical protein